MQKSPLQVNRMLFRIPTCRTVRAEVVMTLALDLP